MSERMRARIHLEGGESIPVPWSVLEVGRGLQRCAASGSAWLLVDTEAGDVVAWVTVARVVWVSAIDGAVAS